MVTSYKRSLAIFTSCKRSLAIFVAVAITLAVIGIVSQHTRLEPCGEPGDLDPFAGVSPSSVQKLALDGSLSKWAGRPVLFQPGNGRNYSLVLPLPESMERYLGSPHGTLQFHAERDHFRLWRDNESWVFGSESYKATGLLEGDAGGGGLVPTGVRSWWVQVANSTKKAPLTAVFDKQFVLDIRTMVGCT
jgi:hypothetical protein